MQLGLYDDLKLDKIEQMFDGKDSRWHSSKLQSRGMEITSRQEFDFVDTLPLDQTQALSECS